MNKSPIKILRAFWGDQPKSWQEIPKSPTWDNETIFVWGTKNYHKLTLRGYDCIMMSHDMLDKAFTNYQHFGHKLECLNVADDIYDEYLFLDWDVKVVKEIDDNFWNLVKSKQTQCPVYAYPNDYYEKVMQQVEKHPEWKNENSDNIKQWVYTQDSMINKYHWQLNDIKVIPNFCFYYTYKGKLGKKLIDTFNEYKPETCVDELSLFIYINTNLDSYLNQFEPFVIRGRESDCRHFEMIDDNSNEKLNNYLDQRFKKDTYLIHE